MRKKGKRVVVYLLCMAMASNVWSPPLLAYAREGAGDGSGGSVMEGAGVSGGNLQTGGVSGNDSGDGYWDMNTVSGGNMLRKLAGRSLNCYYVDSVGGDDLNQGTAADSAWKSLEKLNSTTFAPGDKIYLKSGSIWHGQLWPKGSGTKNAPIVIDSYGEGSKPLIAGNSTMIKSQDNDYFKGAAVVLHNQEYWEINNLEITNIGPETSTGPDADIEKVKDIRRMGVVISTRSPGDGKETYNHIYLKNLDIHDITGSQDRNNGGILVVNQTGGNRTNFQDIRILDCSITNIIGNGITTTSDYIQQYMGTPETGGSPTRWGEFPGKTTVDWGSAPQFRSKNVLIANNRVSNVWCDAILTINFDRPVMEYNVCSNNCYAEGAYAAIWPHSSNDAVMQFNEVYDTRYVGGDGQAFDVDYNCGNAIVQYNYSHDNEGGFLLLMESANYPVVRYNISQNDGVKGTGRGILDIAAGNVSVYNNTFYADVPVFSNRVEGGFAGNGTIRNNIFYAKEPVTVSAWKTTAKKSYTYQNNAVYQYSSQPEDKGLITADPRLRAPGSASFGLDSTDGYKLSPESPCIDRGVEIANSGGRDYFGNLLTDGKTDVGAFEALEKSQGEDIPVKVQSIMVSSQDGCTVINSKNPVLQMYAEVFPFEADVQEVEWKVESLEGENTQLASIDETGLLTGLDNGIVRVLAKAKDGSGAVGTMEIKLEITATGANQIVDDLNVDDFSKMYEHSGELWMDKNGASYFGDNARLIRSNKFDTSYIRYATYHYERISGFKITSYYQNYAETTQLPIEDIRFYVSPDNENWREITLGEYTTEDKMLPRGEEGGSLWTKRIYSCSGLEGGDNFFKVTFPQTYEADKFYDPNIGQIILNLAAQVDSLQIGSDKDVIDQAEGTLQMTARAYPEDIPYQSVNWTVTNLDGTKTDKAIIDANGLLKACNNGTVLVKAQSRLDHSIFAVKEIGIRGQLANITDTYSDFSKIYEHQGLQLEHVSWFDGGTNTIHPFADSTGKIDRYMVYHYQDMKGFRTATYFLNGVERSLRFFSSTDGETYTEITNVPYDTVTKGGTSGKEYHMENMADGIHYLKIQFEDGFSWESNIASTRLFFGDMTGKTIKVISDEDKIETFQGKLQMHVEPLTDVFWSVTDEEGKPTDKAVISQDGVLTGNSRGTVLVWATALADQSITAGKEIVIDTKVYKEIFDDLRYSEGFETGNADNLLTKAAEHSGGFWHQKNPAGMEAYGIYVNNWMSPSYVMYECKNLRSFQVQTLCRYDYVDGSDFTFQVSKDKETWVAVEGVAKSGTEGGYKIVTYDKEGFDQDYRYLKILYPASAESARADINLCSVKMLTEIKVENITIEGSISGGADDCYVIPQIGQTIQFQAETGTESIPGLIAWSVEDVAENAGERAAKDTSGSMKSVSARASITQDGLLTALDYGKAAVTAAATDGSNVSKTVYVEIASIPVQSVVLNKTSKLMEIGDTLNLKYRIAPENSSDQQASFSSSAPEVASVDESSGKVTAHKKGEAVITVTTVDGGKQASCTITVSHAKDYLKTLVQQAQSLNESDYLTESWAGLPEALEYGQKTLADPYAYNRIWQQAADSLKAAIDGLVNREEVSARLRSLVNRAKALDFTKYTESSYAPVQTFLAQAIAVLEEGTGASRSAISQAQENLSNALDGLQEKEVIPPENGDDPSQEEDPVPGEENPPKEENTPNPEGKPEEKDKVTVSSPVSVAKTARKSPLTGDDSQEETSMYEQSDSSSPVIAAAAKESTNSLFLLIAGITAVCVLISVKDGKFH